MTRPTTKLAISIAAAGALAACAGQGERPRYRGLRPTANPSAVVAAELAFARAAQEKGQWTAFREYAADEMGARICGQPMWLASALAKIDNAAHQVPNMEAERAPATAHMFIINPLSGQGMDNLFATHPSTQNRIAALQRLTSQFGGGGFAPPTSPPARDGSGASGPWGGAARPRGPWG